MRLAEPWLLMALVLVAGVVVWSLLSKSRPRLMHPSLAWLLAQGLPAGRWVRWRHLPNLLRCVALCLLVVALARPQQGVEGGQLTDSGVDIMVALDLSGSMAAQDFKPDRISVAKEVVGRFVERRAHDRVGLVVFAADAYTQVPLTLDHRVVQALLEQVDLGLIEDGTAIGSALATAIGRLAKSDAKSRVVVLLTDGNNNQGEIDPLTAAELAEELGIRVYTVGVGRKGSFVQMTDDPLFGRRAVTMQTRVDEALLEAVAQRTGGQFFRAQDEDALREIYDRIDALETSEFDASIYLDYRDRYLLLVLLAMLLLGLEWVLSATRLRRLPG